MTKDEEQRANRILLVDDDEELCELIVDYLTVEGFVVECVHDGESGAEKMLSNEFDLTILDVMLPRLNGFDVLRRVREKSNQPVLMLTARGDDMERIVGLEIGADDYLSKPFNPRELVARLRAILRRTRTDEAASEDNNGDRIRIDDVEVNTAARTVKSGETDLQLTALEFDLLAALMKNAGNIVKREDISREILGRKLSPFDRSLDMHISNLRKKLGTREDNHERIKTIRSVGYIYTKAI